MSKDTLEDAKCPNCGKEFKAKNVSHNPWDDPNEPIPLSCSPECSLESIE